MKASTLTKTVVILIIASALILGAIQQTPTVDARRWHPYPTHTPTPTAPPTSTPKPTPTSAPTPSPTPIPTATPSPTSNPTSTPSPSASIQIYSDQACTSIVSSINWGALSPGATTTLVLYVQNRGNTAVTLSKTLSNWNPPTLSTYLALNWDYSNQVLSPGTSLKVTLRLIVSPSVPATSSFGFSTTISATGS